MRALALLAAIGAGAGVTHADAMQTAQRIFDQQCASCHTLQPTPRQPGARAKLDLSTAFTKRDEVALRQWLFQPARLHAETQCRARLVTQVEQDIMLKLLKHGTGPRHSPPPPPPLAGRQHQQTVTREKPEAVLVEPSPHAARLVDPPRIANDTRPSTVRITATSASAHDDTTADDDGQQRHPTMRSNGSVRRNAHARSRGGGEE